MRCKMRWLGCKSAPCNKRRPPGDCSATCAEIWIQIQCKYKIAECRMQSVRVSRGSSQGKMHTMHNTANVQEARVLQEASAKGSQGREELRAHCTYTPLHRLYNAANMKRGKCKRHNTQVCLQEAWCNCNEQEAMHNTHVRVQKAPPGERRATCCALHHCCTVRLDPEEIKSVKCKDPPKNNRIDPIYAPWWRFLVTAWKLQWWCILASTAHSVVVIRAPLQNANED